MATLVCGFGRCGSSLVMGMLDAGGVPVVGRRPAYEVGETAVSVATSWLLSLNGKAVKVLDPQRVLTHKPTGCRVIWLERDAREQARSQIKFMRMVGGIPIASNGWKRLARSYATDRNKAMRILTGLPIIRLKFEDILASPRDAARMLSGFFPTLNREAAAARVIKRDPACAEGLDIEISQLAF